MADKYALSALFDKCMVFPTGEGLSGDVNMTLSVLTEQELLDLTGYSLPSKQLEALKSRGFVRAYRGRNGRVIVERPHYDSVCRGEYQPFHQTSIRRSPNVSIFKKE